MGWGQFWAVGYSPGWQSGISALVDKSSAVTPHSTPRPYASPPKETKQFY